MTSLEERLFALQDKTYAAFQAKLTPGVPIESFIGIRVPDLRKLAKAYGKEDEHEIFMKQLPHRFYDENMLHALLIAQTKDHDECVARTEAGKNQNMERIIAHVHLPFWAEDAHDALSGQGFHARNSGDSSRSKKRGILCEDDGGLVLCHSTCQTMGSHDSLYRTETSHALDTQQNDTEGD